MKLKVLVKIVILLNMISFGAQAQKALVSAKVPYYGDAFYSNLNSGISNQDLVIGLKHILRSYHLAVAGRNDQVLATCGRNQSCYVHRAIGYSGARIFLMGKFYLRSSGGEYGVEDVYCQRDYKSSEFESQKPGPGKIPDNRILNAEHTWPQSRFNPSFPDDMQKSDMHHIYPADSHLNSVRGNHEFGEVTNDRIGFDCKTTARFGTNSKSAIVFEPPETHKGNVARALFYFSVRYDLPIREDEEAALRKWNNEDPVDAEEMDRNEKIMALQGDRNPFVDFPDLVDKISNF